MSQQLKKSVQVWKLARDLRTKITDDPVADILRFCDRRVRKFLAEFPDCTTLSDLLDCTAAKVGTVFETTYTGDAVRQIQQKYLEKGEKIFTRLEEELTDDVFGITFKRVNRERWEPEFVSVIDCRGQKAARSYYTKWHEVAHLLVLTDQMRLSFRRTHCPTSLKDPEEAIMDVIAGTFGFYTPFVRGQAKGEISFEAIENIREHLCPEASQQSSLIGFTKTWPHPCLLVRAEMALRKWEEAQLYQQTFPFDQIPMPVLRAVRVSASEAAREARLTIFENMRVPEGSIIQHLFGETLSYAEAEEDLSWWEASSGTRLPVQRIRVKARRSWDSVDALIIPIN